MSLKLTVANCRNVVCPWAKSKVKRDGLLMYRDHVVGFSSAQYRNKFAAATNHFDDCIIQNHVKSSKTTPQATCINTHCPWSNKKVTKDSLTMYKSFQVGFCNPGCRDDFSSAVSLFDSLIDVVLLDDVSPPETTRKRLKKNTDAKFSVAATTEGMVETTAADSLPASATRGSPRCSWATDPVFHHYHDTEWGVPCRDDDRYLFEMLILEGAQAGLSWRTILNKREHYKAAFDDFDIATVAAYDQEKVESLLLNPGIVRNKLKVGSAITNAKGTLLIQEEFGSFGKYLWKFVDNTQIVNSPGYRSEVLLTTSPQSDALSKDLKKRGFKFVGSTIMYAFVQAVGMVDDHEHTCAHKPPHHV